MTRRALGIPRRDEAARIPFAVIAVVLLMMVSVSGAFIMSIDRRQMENTSQRTAARELDEAGDLVKSQLEDQLFMLSYTEVSDAVAGLEGLGATYETSEAELLGGVNEAMRTKFDGYLAERFPMTVGGVRAELAGGGAGGGDGGSPDGSGHTVSVLPGVSYVEDSVPAGIIKGDAGGAPAGGYEALYDEEMSYRYGEVSNASQNAYYVCAGHVRVRLVDIRSGLTMVKDLNLSREIKSPFPMMRAKLGRLASELQGAETPLARVLSYVLDCICQYNALRLTWDSIDGASPPSPLIDPADVEGLILSREDGEIAVSIALVLFLAKEFRDIDADFVEALDDFVLSSFDTAGQSPLARMVDEWTSVGTIDPADIVFLYRRMTPEKLDVKGILAKAVCSNVDNSFQSIVRNVEVLSTLSEAMQGLYDEFVYDRYLPYLDDEDFAQKVVDGETIEVYLRRIGYEVLQSILVLYEDLDWGLLSGRIYDDFITYLLTDPADQECFRTSDPPSDLVLNIPQYRLFIEDMHDEPFFPEWFTIIWPQRTMTWDIDFLREQNKPYWNSFFQDLLDAWQRFKDGYSNLLGDFTKDSILTVDADMTLHQHQPSPYDNSKGPLDDLALDIDTALEETIDSLKGSPEIGDFAREFAVLARDVPWAFYHFIEDQFTNLHSYLDEPVLDYAKSISGWGSGYTYEPEGEVWNAAFHTDMLSGLWYTCYGFAGMEYHHVYIQNWYELDIEADTNPWTAWRWHDTSGIGLLSGHDRPGNDEEYYTLPIPYDKLDYVTTGDSPGKQLYIDFITKEIYPEAMNDLRTRILDNDLKPRVDELEEAIKRSTQDRFQPTETANFLDEARLQVRTTFEDIASMEAFSNRKVQVGTDLSEPSFSIGRAGQPSDGPVPVAADAETFQVDLGNGGLLGSGVTVTVPAGEGDWTGNYVFHENYMDTPYESSTTVNVQGTFALDVRTTRAELLGDRGLVPTTYSRGFEVNLDVPITIYTPWPLIKGVDYRLPIDFFKNIGAFTSFADAVKMFADGPLGHVVDTLTKLVECVADLSGTVTGFDEGRIKVLYEALQLLIDSLSSDLRSPAAGGLSMVSTIFRDMVLKNFGYSRLRLLHNGWSMAVDVLPADEAEGDMSWDRLSITMASVPMGTGECDWSLGFDLRLVRLNTRVDPGGGLDLLVDGSMSLEGRDLEFHFDPLMRCYPFLGQVKGLLSDDLALCITLPMVEERAQTGWKLSSVVALPSVPVPAMGGTAYIDAGLTVGYEDVKGCDIVINEVELNDDGGLQWVELHNPTASPQALAGLYITSLNPGDGRDPLLGPRVQIVGAEGSGTGPIAPGGFATVALGGTFMRKADAAQAGRRGALEWACASDGLQLIRKGGVGYAVIDRTPTFLDAEPGPLTWQRRFDGSTVWAHAPATKGRSNDPAHAAGLGLPSEVLAAGLGNVIRYGLVEAFEGARTALDHGAPWTLDLVAAIVKEAIARFVARLPGPLEGVVGSVTVWYRVVLPEAGADGGVGPRSSVTGGAGGDLRGLMAWAGGAASTHLARQGVANVPEAWPSLPSSPSGTYVADGAMFGAPVPGVVSQVMEDIDLGEREATPTAGAWGGHGSGTELSVEVGANVPLLCRLSMLDGADGARAWFGACVRGLPVGPVGRYFGTSGAGYGAGDDDGASADLWMMRGEVYGV